MGSVRGGVSWCSEGGRRVRWPINFLGRLPAELWLQSSLVPFLKALAGQLFLCYDSGWFSETISSSCSFKPGADNSLIL